MGLVPEPRLFPLAHYIRKPQSRPMRAGAQAPHRHPVPGLHNTRMVTSQVAESRSAEGFPLSEGSGELSGNWGLLDQVVALTWVQTHIGAFGGDPQRVTLAADRGGADVASIHLLTTRATDSRLFQRAVLMVSLLLCLQSC